ncbi:MAG: hypothetical protein GY749_13540 [Desulfobacteraceae bacterium]|nr:hypothetical protein [Desulfobacteraceae bacterium]
MMRYLYFGFEDGSHWKRWGAMADEAKAMAEIGKAKTVLFRTPELLSIPGKKWNIASTIEAAKGMKRPNWYVTG